MIQDISIFSYIRDLDTLYDRNRIQRFLEGLAAKGYYLAAEIDWKDVFHVWWQTLYGSREDAPPPVEVASHPDPGQIFTPGLSSALQNRGDSYVHEQQDELSVHAYSTKQSGLLKAFEFTLKLEPNSGDIYISVEDRHFTLEDRQRGLRTYEHWLEILIYIYYSWHPVYAYSFNWSGEKEDTTREQALALDIHTLYEVNIFGPDIVAKLGRERVLSTPAWRVDPIDDGGVMVVPEAYSQPSTQYGIERAAQHLGLRA